jgi:hypothetical protein
MTWHLVIAVFTGKLYFIGASILKIKETIEKEYK